MKKQALVSVIVPVYKTEMFLRQCINSILGQTYKNLEIILVDDGSPDKCPEICDEYAEKDDRVIVIHQKNAGQSCARNAALDICRGEYISFVDSDDWLELDTYESVMQIIDQYEVDVVSFAANFIRGEKTESVGFAFFPNGTIKSSKEMIRMTLEDRIGGQPWTKVYASKCWSGVRFPAGRIYEDLAVSFRPFLSAIGGTYFCQKPFYNYRMNSFGTSLSENPNKNYDIFLAFKDHYEYAIENEAHSVEVCLAKTAAFAIGYLNNRLRYGVLNHRESLQDTTQWLKEHKESILACGKLDKRTQIMLRVYFISSKMYTVAYKVYLALNKKDG